MYFIFSISKKIHHKIKNANEIFHEILYLFIIIEEWKNNREFNTY